MSQFPISSPTGLYDAVNYLASGPSSTGQILNGFNGFVDYFGNGVAYLTGNFRIPYSQSTPANLYVAPINLSNAEQLDNRTIKYTFSSAQPSPPFAVGNGMRITGITPSTYNSANLNIQQIGVVECTTTYFIVRSRDILETPLGTYVSGGQVTNFTSANVDDSSFYSTDCDIRINVNGSSDKVAVNGQLDQKVEYDVISGPSDFSVYVAIRRYAGTPNNDPVNPEYLFNFESYLTGKRYDYTGLTGTGTLDISTVFQTVLDQPGIGFYRYILEVLYEYPTGGVEVQVTNVELGLRSITAQTGK